jgi:hypothetical protein
MSCRAGELWTERKVSWYRRAIARSDYAATVPGAVVLSQNSSRHGCDGLRSRGGGTLV